ncbi:MAG TPA: hypothetical protein PLV01_03655 [Candidatus Kapabacteria bacterium]|nr:hypothetical protein [Candidatus Kapabacteria bacterium]HPU24035.1 hypothetical protein [Candidatus Kapabacteria bacterium]
MKTILIIGATTVTLALISYSIAIISEQRSRIVSKKVLYFLSIGWILDVAATIMMIVGSSNTPFTLHGAIGYSALLLMTIETYFIWRLIINNGYNVEVPKKLHIYSRLAYIWWVAAYITGSLLVFIK